MIYLKVYFSKIYFANKLFWISYSIPLYTRSLNIWHSGININKNEVLMSKLVQAERVDHCTIPQCLCEVVSCWKFVLQIMLHSSEPSSYHLPYTLANSNIYSTFKFWLCNSDQLLIFYKLTTVIWLISQWDFNRLLKFQDMRKKRSVDLLTQRHIENW